MANKIRNIGKGSRSETEVAQIVSDKLRSRKDRDALTRAVGAIKVTDTQARQWNRWSV
jgi:hypothetical protein